MHQFNHLTHAACLAGMADITASLFRLLGKRVTRTPWSYTGDPEKQIAKWRNDPRHRV